MEGPYVLGVGTVGHRPYSGFSKAHKALLSSTGTSGWRFHDCRRTAVTLAQRAAVRLEVCMALTGHRTPGMIGVYARHEYREEKISAVRAIKREVLKVLRGESGKIVPMIRKG